MTRLDQFLPSPRQSARSWGATARGAGAGEHSTTHRSNTGTLSATATRRHGRHLGLRTVLRPSNACPRAAPETTPLWRWFLISLSLSPSLSAQAQSLKAFSADMTPPGIPGIPNQIPESRSFGSCQWDCPQVSFKSSLNFSDSGKSGRKTGFVGGFFLTPTKKKALKSKPRTWHT